MIKTCWMFIYAMLLCTLVSSAQPNVHVRKSDRKKDVLMQTDAGIMIFRLYDETPQHRDNFLTLVKAGYYNGISFHRVIQSFMIQAGDERTKQNIDTNKLLKDYTIPAEFRPELFHHKGVLAAARMGNDVNPQKASSGVQFYIVQGRVHTDFSLDSVETFRLEGRKLPIEHRAVYKIEGGSPHLDQNYTIFGNMIRGMDVLDSIASVKTTGKGKGDKPLSDIRIVRMKLIRRKMDTTQN